VNEPPDVLAVVLPLVDGKREQVRALLAHGPPFDPESVGLLRHHVFLGDAEVVFVFEAVTGAGLERIVAAPSVWSAAAGWHDVIAGAPRVTRLAYTWEAAEENPDLFFGATPGPGDSDGGDYDAP
jgi:hypothetical protein